MPPQVEEHFVNGRPVRCLVHRKGATRAFPPHHPLVPVDYQFTGQPVLIGGTMGTCSYVLAGTDKGMEETFGSTSHGAGRARSRNNSRHKARAGPPARLNAPLLLSSLGERNCSDFLLLACRPAASSAALALSPTARRRSPDHFPLFLDAAAGVRGRAGRA